MSIAVADLQSCVTNRLPDVGPDLQLAGIIGDTPSRHAKSPSLWNAAFRHFDIGAVFLAFDVAPGGLEAMVRALRENPRVAGFSVTAPYKVDVLPLLDEVEARAARIGAVNTVVRTPEGRLVGHNTDGQGALDSLTRTLPGATAPFFPDLAGRRVLLFGAGGAARAVSHFLAGPLADGSLWIANRHRDRADALCQSLSDLPVRARVVADAEVDTLLPQADLVVNCSTIGQAGVRAVGAGRATCLEPFSALAAAEPPAIETAQPGSDSALYRQVVELDRAALADNHARALDRCLLAGPETRFFDVVYAPLESVFLQHARWTGHPTLNGKGMNVAQAADGLFNQVFRRLFETRGLATDATYADLVRFLTTVW